MLVRVSLLSLNNFSLSFDAAEVVKNISFSIEKGEMLALVGESGSGKSLTALSCLGLQPESAAVSGSIRFDGQEIIGASEVSLRAIRGRRVGMIFQEPMTALNPLHTIGKQIAEASPAEWRGPDQTPQQVRGLLDQVGLSYLKDRLGAYPHQLSGGERQRVMIAMAIANKPGLLIADEPTTAVDVTIQVKILSLLKDLQKEMRMAILFITHDLTIVQRLADRVAVMNRGNIVEQGKVADIFAAPKHEYTRHLLASQPKGAPLPYPPDAKPVMACKNLKVWFSIKKGLLQRTSGYIKAVDDVTLSIPEKSTLGVVGESGSGKTTLGFALLRLIKSEGLIVFLGQDIHPLKTRALRPLRSHMQVVFQDPFSSLNPRMTVRAAVGEGLLVHQPDKSKAAREAEIDAILNDVGLTSEMKERYPHEFSGGQRQRISIARAMVLRPRFVVLDEPTSALDVSVQAQIIDLLKNLQRKYGLTMLFISHDLRVVRALAHHIIVMHQGKIIEQGDTKTMFDSPQHDYTKTLINAAFMRK
ncbi:MAG: ABC transporter ATP-binding protein [Pseudomonadota bacterium]|nr:ABC transporter ATP-binding protein [Pseudomonadota bacterium]MDE3036971.1 ABC transporter ATP-binding protein [Pseudomonadota bacterium]